jgi:putative endonuclease
MAKHNTLGKKGEEEAVGYLLSNGYRIRHRNWKFGRYELDIVAEKEGTLVCVEVRTRANDRLYSPEESISYWKMRRTLMAMDKYVDFFSLNMPVRFDVIAVTGTDGDFKIKHIQEAFSPITIM